MNLDADSIFKSPFFVGALGSLVALKFVPGVTWPERITTATSGALCAGYLTPGLMEWLQVTSNGLTNAAAFVLGMLSMSLAAAVLEGLRATKFGDIISSWLTRR